MQLGPLGTHTQPTQLQASRWLTRVAARAESEMGNLQLHADGVCYAMSCPAQTYPRLGEVAMKESELHHFVQQRKLVVESDE